MGVRTNAASTDFSDFLPEELAQELREAAIISMGTEVSEEDIENISSLCDQVVSISEYREQLFEYLKNRMQAIAPNLTIMVGELVGARLIAHAGSLLNLAKHPASTVQILGAEKALFRALKTKHETPKYGLIFHASLIGQAPPKLKGKISRVLAAKTSLAVRCDSFGEGDANTDIGIESRAKVENRLRSLEGSSTHRISGNGKSVKKDQQYNSKTSNGTNVRPASAYNASADVKIKKVEKVEEVQEEVEEQPKKKSKKAKVESNGNGESPVIKKKKRKLKENLMKMKKKYKKKNLRKRRGKHKRKPLKNQYKKRRKRNLRKRNNNDCMNKSKKMMRSRHFERI